MRTLLTLTSKTEPSPKSPYTSAKENAALPLYHQSVPQTTHHIIPEHSSESPGSCYRLRNAQSDLDPHHKRPMHPTCQVCKVRIPSSRAARALLAPVMVLFWMEGVVKLACPVAPCSPLPPSLPFWFPQSVLRPTTKWQTFSSARPQGPLPNMA